MAERQPNERTSRRDDRTFLRLVLRAGEILSSALDWQETVNAVCEAVVDTVADICVLYIKDEADEVRVAAFAHRDPSLAGDLRDVERLLREKLRSRHPIYTVLENGDPIFAPVVDDAYIKTYALNAWHEQLMRRIGYRSLMILPLKTQTRGIVGALTMVRTAGPAYDEDAFDLGQDLARRCAAAIGKALLYNDMERVATVFQQAALPAALPEVEGIAFDAIYEPSSENMLVGGDWYDAFPLEDGRIAITVGDVLGHGLQAAAWMSRLRNGFRAALFADSSPARALEVVDRMLQVEAREEFTTAVVAIVDPVRNTLTCASAGHPGPLVWDGSGSVSDPFEDRGLPLGCRHLGRIKTTAQTLDVRPGSFAAFFTDGLLEWDRDIASAWEALHAALRRQDVREAPHPARQIRSAVISGSGHQDDVAVLTVRWDAVAGPLRGAQ